MLSVQDSLSYIIVDMPQTRTARQSILPQLTLSKNSLRISVKDVHDKCTAVPPSAHVILICTYGITPADTGLGGHAAPCRRAESGRAACIRKVNKQAHKGRCKVNTGPDPQTGRTAIQGVLVPDCILSPGPGRTRAGKGCTMVMTTRTGSPVVGCILLYF